jgi:hypothetical protein
MRDNDTSVLFRRKSPRKIQKKIIISGSPFSGCDACKCVCLCIIGWRVGDVGAGCSFIMVTGLCTTHFAAVVSGLGVRRGGHFHPWVFWPCLLSSVRPEGSFPLVSVVVEALGALPMNPLGAGQPYFGRCGRFWLVGGVVSDPQPTFPRGAQPA